MKKPSKSSSSSRPVLIVPISKKEKNEFRHALNVEGEKVGRLSMAGKTRVLISQYCHQQVVS